MNRLRISSASVIGASSVPASPPPISGSAFAGLSTPPGVAEVSPPPPVFSSTSSAAEDLRGRDNLSPSLLVNLGDSSRPVTHYGMMGLARGSFAGDIVTTGLQVLNLSSAGAIAPREGATTTFEPLVQSSADAGLMDAPLFKALVDPTILLDDAA